MAIDKKSIKKMFPNLIKELEGSENKVQINSIRANAAQAEEELDVKDEVFPSKASNDSPDLFRHYNPTVEDFIRRCDTETQAEEIVAYMLKKGEITSEEADKIRKQLQKDGVRSFGPKKENDYYFKQSGII